MGHLEQLQPDLFGAALFESKSPRNFIGDVEFASFDEGSAIIDADHLAAVVSCIDDPHDRSQGERRVSGRRSVHVVRLAGGGGLPVKIITVPA